MYTIAENNSFELLQKLQVVQDKTDTQNLHIMQFYWKKSCDDRSIILLGEESKEQFYVYSMTMHFEKKMCLKHMWEKFCNISTFENK